MIHQELQQREREGRALRIASTGAEWMGTGFVTAMNHVSGMEIVVLADPEPGRAARALENGDEDRAQQHIRAAADLLARVQRQAGRG